MTALLLAVQLFAHAVVNGYAAQVKKDVVVSITFADVRPTKVCVYLYAIDDEELAHATDTHCWIPSNDISLFDVWENMRLDEGNFKAVVTYRDRPSETVLMVWKVNT